MSCELCGRGSCTRSFHSLHDQEDFDNKTGKYAPEEDPAVQQSLTTEPPSAGLSEVLSDEDFVKSLDEVWAHSLEAADQYTDRADGEHYDRILTSHRALAQRLREAEDRLSTTIRVSQEYASETAQTQQRLREVEQFLEEQRIQTYRAVEREQALKQRIAQLDAQVDEARAECRRIECLNAELEAQVNKLKHGYGFVKTMHAMADREVEELKQQLATAQAEIQRLTSCLPQGPT